MSPLLDIVLAPFVWGAGIVLWGVRRFGVQRLTVCRAVLRSIGVFPVRSHYYEPLFETNHLKQSLDAPRNLPGIQLNDAGQLSLLSQFDYRAELERFPKEPQSATDFFFHNGAFESGDAELLYSMIRHFKPTTIIEIGSGMSTLMARAAIKQNQRDGSGHCRQVCVEPYEHAWLADLDVELVRERVEELDLGIFGALETNDILFIDSSHIIRPQGDVLFEFLELLPTLKPGVLVHVHDIFTPRDYLKHWVVDEVRFWNEQYLLEAFLTNNSDFQVVVAANYLAHSHSDAFRLACPVYASESESREPGSFWMVRLE